MPETNGNQLVTIGENIKAIRKKKGLTLSQLATATGLSAPFLSQIENARVNINLNTLNEICNALEVSIVSLFGEEKNTNVRLIKRENRQWYSLAGRSVESFLLNLKSNIELSIIRLPPGENTGISNQHEGDEVCYVLKGSIRVILDDATIYELGESDMIYYKSDVPHRWENGSTDIAEFIVFNSPATF
jgi:transcriptional regulator with XRE-family HTH domain